MSNNRNLKPVSAAPAPAPATAPIEQQAATNATEQAASNNAAGDPQADDGAIVEARVLVAFYDFMPNDIFTGSADEVAELEDDHKVDSNAKAVAYAKSLIGG